MNVRYLIRPKADQDVDDQALLATKASTAVGHRFLVAAHETFSLLASRPGIGWHPRLKIPELRPMPEGVEILRVIHGSRNLLILLRREELE